METDDGETDVLEDRLWKKSGWIARVIKNEDGEGWAAEMTRVGESEPSLGLAPLVVREVFQTIRALAQRGLTILLVEQNVALSLKISQRAYVLENGRIVMSGTGAELLADDRVRQSYLGIEAGQEGSRGIRTA